LGSPREGLSKKKLLCASQNCHFIGSPLLTLAGWHPAQLAVGRSIILVFSTNK
jgi:hypothetical protein